MRRRPASATPRQQAVALQAASLLLSYPDELLVQRQPLLRAVAAGLPADAATPLLRLCRAVQSSPLAQLQAHYTEVFDLQRRSCLYLTYFSHGDTRQRGMALLRFNHAYRAAGLPFDGTELPDHLSVVCEFAATGHLDDGLRLLTEHRAAIELVRAALADAASCYVDALDLVRGVLPPATPRDVHKAQALARSGPPEEAVGLEPFGPPELVGGRR